MNSTAHVCNGLIFDLDGTLVDSVPDIAASLNAYFATQGWPHLEDAFVAKHIGHGTQRLVRDILQTLGLPHDAARLQTAVMGYLNAYQANPVHHTRLFAHVEDDLRTLYAQGFKLGVCTNKPQDLSDQILHALGIDRLFSAVVGADAVPACKPDPEHLLITARRMGLQRNDWVYIGDSRVDQATASAADVPFYAVPWGTGPSLPVAPEYRLKRLADLSGCVGTHNALLD